MIQKTFFRQNKGLGNEVGYYIFGYPAEQELFVRERCLTFITSSLRLLMDKG